MARSLWTGSLSFGLVNVPVQLFSAVHDLDLHFHQLHESDGARIDTRRFCADEDTEIPYEEIGRAFEPDDGEQIILTDAELASVQPRKTRTIDIEAFVDLEDVDPIYFDHPYFLLPAGEGEGVLRAYRLLVEAMGSTDRAALGRFVMRTKEYLGIIRVRDDLLTITTMLFHDEVRDAGGIDTGGKKPKKAELDNAVALIEAMSEDWDPERYSDCYRKRLQKVVAEKKKGKTIEAPKQESEPTPAPDLMAALEATLEEIKGKSAKSSSGSGSKKKAKA
jgi:DNA end-binding protein Ku